MIPIVVIGGILLSVLFYLRRKRRNARQRGFRLGSDSNLPPPTFLVHDPASNPFADPHHPFASGGSPPVMAQHKGSSQITSLFLPSETVFTRSSHSRSSFTTNSVSTASISATEYARQRARRLGPDPYGPRDSTSLFAPSTTDYDSRSSAAYTYDEDDDDEGGRRGDDESISPFSDIHRPRPTVLASRNNLHNTRGARRGSEYYSPSVLSASASSETDSMLSSRDDHDDDDDAESVITLSSRISKLSRRAPSSSGATYGGAHDDDDEEDDDDVATDRGYETERFDHDDDDDDETEGGYDTEVGTEHVEGSRLETEAEMAGAPRDDVSIASNSTLDLVPPSRAT